MKLHRISPEEVILHDGISLAADAVHVIRDANGVPVEWTLLRTGDNPLVKNGVEGSLLLTEEDMDSILKYFHTKGELIPVDSNHFLHRLALAKNMDECDVLKFIPSGVAAMGFGSLFSLDGDLRFRVQWIPAAYELLKEKIFRYFSPALRGLLRGPLRVTSVALENEPAINRLDALAASADQRFTPGPPPETIQHRKEYGMTKLEHALGRLLGRDALALDADSPESGDTIAQEIEAKAELIGEFRKALKLKDDVPDSLVVLALRTLLEKAGGADELAEQLARLQNEISSLKQDAEKKKHDELIEQGVRQGKITPATKEWWEKLDNLQLSAHLPGAPVLVPQGRTLRNSLSDAEDGAALTAEDRAACRKFGFSEKEFLAQKKNCR